MISDIFNLFFMLSRTRIFKHFLCCFLTTTSFFMYIVSKKVLYLPRISLLLGQISSNAIKCLTPYFLIKIRVIEVTSWLSFYLIVSSFQKMEIIKFYTLKEVCFHFATKVFILLKDVNLFLTIFGGKTAKFDQV